eukprot:gene8894-844_t
MAKRKLECDECGKSYTEARMKKHKKTAHPEEIDKKPEKQIEFIPEVLNEVISYLPVKNKIYINFMNVSKQFYQVFMDSNFSKVFKLDQMLDKNFHKIEKQSQSAILDQMKKLIEKEESRIGAIEKETNFKKKWMKKYEKPKKTNKKQKNSSNPFHPESPYSKESYKIIEEVPNNLEIISFSKTIIGNGAAKELACHVKYFGFDLKFCSSELDSYPREYCWSVSHWKNQNIVYFLMNENGTISFDTDLQEMKDNLKLDLSNDEYIDLLNDMAENVVEFGYSYLSTAIEKGKFQ